MALDLNNCAKFRYNVNLIVAGNLNGVNFIFKKKSANLINGDVVN